MRTACLLILFLVVGCRTKLESEGLVQLQPGDKQYRVIDPIAKEQTVNVSATAQSGQFNVYLFLEKNQAEAEKDIERGKTVSAHIPAQQLKATQGSLQMTVPAKEKAVVLLTAAGGKKAEVKLKISN